LSWLAAEARNDLCRQLIALKPDAEQVDDVIDELSSVKDPKGSDFLWELSTRDDLPMSAATQLSLTMQRQLTGGITRFSGEKTPAQIKLSESAVAKAKSGPILQRLTAILLLAEVNRDRASEPAAALAAAPDAAAVRRDAVLIAMVTAPDAEAEKMAIEAAKDPDGMVRSQAVQFLCFGTTNSFKLPTTGTWLRLESRYESYSGLRSNYVEFVPRVPRSLDLETARKLLRDPNPTTSAGAAYLLAVLGDPSGLTTLTRYWRESPRSEWMKLLAMAIASLEDDANVHILEEIYQQMNPEFEIGRHNSEIRSLYWIIRPMEGPNALRLRKRMRAEVGMQTIGTPG
jgi:hypothetical protein